MSEPMGIEAYLEAGGRLTSPGNVPPRYRGELMRIMASFVDSELAGSAGFADVINEAPGIKERISAARIVLEKADHAERVLRVMSDFGVDTGRYAVHHPWAKRLPRQAVPAEARSLGDMRLPVFHFPFAGWTDAVVMNVMMGEAVGLQLADLGKISYAPLADVFRAIAPREARHTELGHEGLARLIAGTAGREAVLQSVAYWRPRVAMSFGHAKDERVTMLQRLGLRHEAPAKLLNRWNERIDAIFA